MFFDAYTAAAAERRRDVDRRGNEPPRVLSAPERHVRLEDQKRRLGKGPHLDDELEISNSLRLRVRQGLVEARIRIRGQVR